MKFCTWPRNIFHQHSAHQAMLTLTTFKILFCILYPHGNIFILHVEELICTLHKQQFNYVALMYRGQLQEHTRDRTNKGKNQHYDTTPIFPITTHYKSYNHTKVLPTENDLHTRLTILLCTNIQHPCRYISKPHTILRLIKRSPQKPYQTLCTKSKLQSIQHQHGITYTNTLHTMQYNKYSNIPLLQGLGEWSYKNKIQIWA